MPETTKKSDTYMESTLVALLTQPNLQKAAKAAGISYTTLWRRLKDPAFQAAYREARRESVTQAMGQLQLASSSAATALQDIFEDPEVSPSARASAARTVLQMALQAVESDDFQVRIEAAEQKLQELPTPEEKCNQVAKFHRRLSLVAERMPADFNLLQDVQYRAMAAAFSPRELKRLGEWSKTQPIDRLRIKDFPSNLKKAGERFAKYLDEIAGFLTGFSYSELVKAAKSAPNDQLQPGQESSEGRKAK